MILKLYIMSFISILSRCFGVRHHTSFMFVLQLRQTITFFKCNVKCLTFVKN